MEHSLRRLLVTLPCHVVTSLCLTFLSRSSPLCHVVTHFCLAVTPSCHYGCKWSRLNHRGPDARNKKVQPHIGTWRKEEGSFIEGTKMRSQRYILAKPNWALGLKRWIICDHTVNEWCCSTMNDWWTVCSSGIMTTGLLTFRLPTFAMSFLAEIEWWKEFYINRCWINAMNSS